MHVEVLLDAAGVLILETLIFLEILKCLSKKIVEDSLIVTEFISRHKLDHKVSGMLYVVFAFSLQSTQEQGYIPTENMPDRIPVDNCI